MFYPCRGCKWVRYISQFKIPPSDCVPALPTRKVIDPKACDHRDRGLVLGVYYNENVKGESAMLTRSAQKYDKKCNGRLWKQLKLTPIPRLGDCRVLYDLEQEFGYVAVAGLGSECLKYNEIENLDESREAIRIAAAVGSSALQKFQPSSIHVESFGNAEVAAEGAKLSTWKFQEYKRPSDSQINPTTKLELFDDCDFDGWRRGKLKAEAQNLARFLQEMPANILTPTVFAKIAVELLCELDVNVEVKTQGWAAHHGMSGFVAIGKSSIQPPLFVEISYHGAKDVHERPIVLIGKGVTFNSGGIDLKSPEELKYMKGDMAGAACVLAITRAAAILKLPINIRGILPLCEIMPSGRSPKFGDVIKAHGKTIEIRLPSREGRILVADCLVYARDYYPKFIIDIGTMSKELCHSLGGAACGCYGNSEDLLRDLITASSLTGDRIWRMPLWKFYEERVKDLDNADLANTGINRYGDSPNAAAFLHQFICDSNWIHLDTYNVAYTQGFDFPYLPKGMTGRPTRTLLEFMYKFLDRPKC